MTPTDYSLTLRADSLIEFEAEINRNQHPLGGMNDAEALTHWLSIYAARRSTTLRSYRGESLKFRSFLEKQRGRLDGELSWTHLLRDATETDLVRYEAALLGLPHAGVQAEIPSIGLPRTGREAFTRPLKRSSVNRALAILHSMYEHFRGPITPERAPYVLTNPVSRLLASSNRAQSQTARIVPEQVIQAMAESIQASISHASEQGNQIDLARAMRLRWIFTLLFGLWGRRAEICSLRMCDFQQTHDGWEAQIRRKGGRTEVLPVGQFVIDGLQNYRIFLGTTPLPPPNDTTPAIAPLQNKGKRSVGQHISEETIYQEVRHLAVETAARISAGHCLLDLSSESRVYILSQLSKFSPHWFRHTAASVAINDGFMTLDSASKMLGHTSTAITASMYHHGDRESMRGGIDKMAEALVRAD